MARFYDAANDSDLKQIVSLLKKGGVVYTLRVLGDDMNQVKEIQVAEEDLDAAERIICDMSSPDN